MWTETRYTEQRRDCHGAHNPKHHSAWRFGGHRLIQMGYFILALSLFYGCTERSKESVSKTAEQKSAEAKRGESAGKSFSAAATLIISVPAATRNRQLDRFGSLQVDRQLKALLAPAFRKRLQAHLKVSTLSYQVERGDLTHSLHLSVQGHSAKQALQYCQALVEQAQVAQIENVHGDAKQDMEKEKGKLRHTAAKLQEAERSLHTLHMTMQKEFPPSESEPAPGTPKRKRLDLLQEKLRVLRTNVAVINKEQYRLLSRETQAKLTFSLPWQFRVLNPCKVTKLHP